MQMAISIHALLAESDLCARGRDRAPAADFYPRSPCGERRFALLACSSCHRISIHALLAESDLCVHRAPICNRRFLSTLSLRRATLSLRVSIFGNPSFLSTLSLRRATGFLRRHDGFNRYFYPRSPCGERPDSDFSAPATSMISIHALLAESDLATSTIASKSRLFLSTLSLRRATRCNGILPANIPISIHALLAESDLPPHQQKRRNWISIHALLAESDPEESGQRHLRSNFYPRSPCGERPNQGA